MGRNFEIRYWMQVFGVSREALEQAVLVVGHHAESVRRYLLGLEEDRRRHAAEGEEAAAGDSAEPPDEAPRPLGAG